MRPPNNSIFRLIASVCAGVIVLSSAALAADEGIFPNGEKIAGRLTFFKDGLVFERADGQAKFALGQLQAVTLAGIADGRPRARLTQRLMLADDQVASGELVSANLKEIVFRLADGTLKNVPRGDVVGIGQPAGYLRMKWLDFEKEDDGWRGTGQVAVTRDATHAFSGKFSLLLNRAGQQVSVNKLGENGPGIAQFFFYVNDEEGDGKWTWSPRSVSGADTNKIPAFTLALSRRQLTWSTPGAKSVSMTRVAGWHQLEWVVRPGVTHIFVDDHLLAQAKEEFSLTGFDLKCDADGRGLWIDDVIRFAEAPPARHRAGSYIDDEFWLGSGDSLFGTLEQADARSLKVTGPFGTRTLSWSDVRAVYFKQGVVKSSGAEVEVAFTSGDARDRLRGRVRDLNDEFLILDHAALGEIRIERGRLRRITPLLAKNESSANKK